VDDDVFGRSGEHHVDPVSAAAAPTKILRPDIVFPFP
jgi:hypothetical protein